MKHAIPRCWSKRWRTIEREFDVVPRPRGRLAAKVLVFKTRRDMKAFWKQALGRTDLGTRFYAAVSGLYATAVKIDKHGRESKPRMVDTDQRYFCVIGLVRKHIDDEVLAHESVHAGFAYAHRATRHPWIAAREFDEEAIAYPAGRIYAALCKIRDQLQ